MRTKLLNGNTSFITIDKNALELIEQDLIFLIEIFGKF